MSIGSVSDTHEPVLEKVSTAQRYFSMSQSSS